MQDLLRTYARRIREHRRAHADASEPALAPHFQRFLEEAFPLLTGIPKLTVAPEYTKAGIGRPDIALVRAGECPRAFVELKSPDKPADPARWRDPHDRRQFARLKTLRSWAASNFLEIRLYERDEPVAGATLVPDAAIRPETPDTKADKLIDAQDTAGLEALLFRLGLSAATPPEPGNAYELAVNLAHAARLLRETVRDHLALLAAEKAKGRPLQDVRDDFRNVLYAHPEAGGYRGEFDTLFSAAFAQTLAFGMLLVRESRNLPVDSSAWEHMPSEHPLMKSALRQLSEPEIREQVGIGFDVLFDMVNGFSPEILAIQPGGRDPILYFYEDFLSVFDPDAKQRYGVYYTPIEVVRYMVGALDRCLREDLNTQGLRDEKVTLLDPAVGTGTFLLGVADRVRADVEKAQEGPVMAGLALRKLAKRLYGFELLIGPYAVAHYRLHHALAPKPKPGDPEPPALPRLGVYLADTLAEAGASTPIGKLGWTAAPIRDERHEADRIKREQRILAIIGNPPYWRFQDVNSREVVGPFVDGLWEDLKAPVRDAGWANQLNTFPEFSVAFWRWAIWKLFEADNAPGKGVIAFITNRTFLAGKPYAGLRKMLRERFDRIEVIDLRGDLRRGARAGVVGDEGVFNIQVGTAITIAVADGSKQAGELARVLYTDTWEAGLFARKAKLGWLEAGAQKGVLSGAVDVKRSGLEALRPEPFGVGDFPALTSLFRYSSSGLQTKRDGFTYAIDLATLRSRLDEFARVKDSVAREMFHDSRDRKWAPARASLRDVHGNVVIDDARLVEAIYRPLDRRHLHNHPAFGDFLRPTLQQVLGVGNNPALYAMPFGTGSGPAVWCHIHLPDYHAFSGRGGYAFPLYDRRPGHGPLNLSPDLIDGLTLAYSTPVDPQDAFDAILALLSATSYTLRFAEDLEDVFPHVPFPADRAVFEHAAAVGRAIREVETFARPPAPDLLPPGFAEVATPPAGPLAAEWRDGVLHLCADGSGKVVGLPQAVWDFAVSGYRVLPRWLAARQGRALDYDLLAEFRDVAGRIRELIHRFDEADLVLEAALQHSLNRNALGLAAVGAESA